MRTILSYMLLLLLFFPSLAIAQPVVEYLEPCSVQRGQTMQLAIHGEQIDRPISLWTSLPSDKMKVSVQKSDAKRAEFKVEVADDCPLGIYGLRLATEDGLSNCMLFLVDDLAPRVLAKSEQEAVLTLPVAIAGVFREGEVERYSIQVKAGEQVSFDAVASRFGTDADPLITIFDAQGKRVTRRDNDTGLFVDCCFEHTFAREGTYTIEIRDARYLGATNWRYVLRMGKFPAARVSLPSTVVTGQATQLKFPEVNSEAIVSTTLSAGGFNFAWKRGGDNASNWVPLMVSSIPSVVEQEPNNAIDVATPLVSVPVFAAGVLEIAGDRDLYSCEVKKGDKLWVRAITKQIQSAADVEIAVLDASGKEIQRSDDTSLPGGALEDASLTFNANQDGKCFFAVREMTGGFGPAHSYRLEIQRSLPRVQLTTDVAACAIPQGSYQSLPLSVVRTDYNGPLELILQDAPPGVRLEPTQIAEGENLVLCKLFAGPETPLGVHRFTVSAKGQAGETTFETQLIFQPLIDKQIVNPDLIKFALRENQRWLPGSLHARGALQILPPIPCEIEPEQPLVILPRYQQVPLRIQTKRTSGFDSAISFSATGGQLGEESQGRRQVFGRFPLSQNQDDAITATFHSRTQANEAKDRIDITVQTQAGPRHITLMRSIMLQVKPAFDIELTPPQATLLPGEQVTLKLTATRLPSFSDAIEIRPNTNAPLELPQLLTIPASGDSVEFSIQVPADYKPRRDRIRFTATGNVSGFLEEPRAREFDLEVKAPPMNPKK